MHGQITLYRQDLGIGIIRADDGRKFRFAMDSVLNADSEMLGESVDFVLVADRPSDIIMMKGSPWNAFGR